MAPINGLKLKNLCRNLAGYWFEKGNAVKTMAYTGCLGCQEARESMHLNSFNLEPTDLKLPVSQHAGKTKLESPFRVTEYKFESFRICSFLFYLSRGTLLLCRLKHGNKCFLIYYVNADINHVCLCPLHFCVALHVSYYFC